MYESQTILRRLMVSFWEFFSFNLFFLMCLNLNFRTVWVRRCNGLQKYRKSCSEQQRRLGGTYFTKPNVSAIIFGQTLFWPKFYSAKLFFQFGRIQFWPNPILAEWIFCRLKYRYSYFITLEFCKFIIQNIFK